MCPDALRRRPLGRRRSSPSHWKRSGTSFGGSSRYYAAPGCGTGSIPKHGRADAPGTLDPDGGLTLEEIRDLVRRRPVEHRRLEDVPTDHEVLAALAREAAAFRGEPQRPPEEAGPPERLDPEALGGPDAVEGLKDWLAGIGRAVLGRKD